MPNILKKGSKGVAAKDLLKSSSPASVAATVETVIDEVVVVAEDAVKNLEELDNVSATTATAGQVLKYVGGQWQPSADLEGAAILNDLTDVNASPNEGDVLTWNSTTSKWEAVVSAGDAALAAANAAQSTADGKVSASLSIDEHSDVDTTTVAPTSGDVLKFDGSNFVPAAPAGGGGGLAQQTATITISPANLANVDTSPYQLLPAPAAGFHNMVEYIVLLTTDAYPLDSVAPVFRYSNGTTISSVPDSIPFMGQMSVCMGSVDEGAFIHNSRIGNSVELYLSTGSLSLLPGVGLKVTLVYKTIALPTI